MFDTLTYDENILLTGMMNRACKCYNEISNHYDYYDNNVDFDVMPESSYFQASLDCSDTVHMLLAQRTGLGLGNKSAHIYKTPPR